MSNNFNCNCNLLLKLEYIIGVLLSIYVVRNKVQQDVSALRGFVSINLYNSLRIDIEDNELIKIRFLVLLWTIVLQCTQIIIIICRHPMLCPSLGHMCHMVQR